MRHGGTGVQVQGTVEGSWLRIAVRDQGSGFPAGFVDHAFDRFTRAETSRTTPGSGLGLSLVMAVATAHGGTARRSTRVRRGAGSC